MYIWGKDRAAGRVGPDFLTAIAGRVGLGPRKVTRGQLCYVLMTGSPILFVVGDSEGPSALSQTRGLHGITDRGNRGITAVKTAVMGNGFTLLPRWRR